MRPNLTPAQRLEHAQEWRWMRSKSHAWARSMWRENRDWVRGLQDNRSAGERLRAALQRRPPGGLLLHPPRSKHE